jgi:hypothetical protein
MHPIPRWTSWRVAFGTSEAKPSFDGKLEAAPCARLIGHPSRVLGPVRVMSVILGAFA